MSKYTPGPWAISRIVRTAINHEDKHVAMVNYSSFENIGPIGEEHEANVNLICAAPDLLEALEKLIIAWETGDRFMFYGYVEDAKTIINKAKGGE